MPTDPSLHVLIIGINYAPEPSGSAPYTAGLARGLAERGHRVDVITTHPHYPQWEVVGGPMPDSTTLEDDVTVRRLRTYVPRTPSTLRRMLFEVLWGLRVALGPLPQADVVIYSSPALFSTGIARLRLSLRRIRHIGWVQDLYSRGVVETGTHTRLAPAVSAVERSVLRSMDAVITIHPNMTRSVERLGVPSRMITMIRNWSHLKDRPEVDVTAVRRRHGWPTEATIALHSGNMGVKQGLEVVIDAARLAEETNSSVHFVLMGDGSQRRELERYGDGALALTFVDPLPDGEYQDAMAAADVLLLVDRPGVGSMSVPSKLTSYFSTGRPVLASTESTSNAGVEVLDSGAGVCVPPGDAPSLLEGVELLAAEPDRARQMGLAGQAFRRDVLSESAGVDAIEALARQTLRR